MALPASMSKGTDGHPVEDGDLGRAKREQRFDVQVAHHLLVPVADRSQRGLVGRVDVVGLHGRIQCAWS